MAERRAQLLQMLQQRKAAATAPAREFWPLSSAQLRIWLHQQQHPESSAYCEPTALRLIGPVNARSVTQCLAQLVQRHESLRTTFLVAEGEPQQRIGSAWSFQLEQTPCLEAELPDLIEAFSSPPFDLEQGPLLRACLFRLAEQDHVLLLVLHHLIVDGWSAHQLGRELVDLLSARPLSSTPACSYREYALEQRSQDQSSHLEYWSGRLQGLEELPLPGSPKASLAKCAQWEFRVDGAVQRDLEERARAAGCTLFSLFLLAWGITLSQWTGSQDLAVAVPVSQRARQEFEEVVGLFLNTLPIRLDLGGDPTLEELAGRHWAAYREDLVHQSCSLEQVLGELPLSADELFSTMVNLQPVVPPDYQQGQLKVSSWPSRNGSCKFPLALNLQNLAEGGWLGRLDYALERFSRASMERLATRFQAILHKLAVQPQMRLSQIGLLESESELLETWERGRQADHPERQLLDFFRDQVAARPESVCLLDSRSQMRYSELDALSDRLAWGLIERGIGPGQRVVLSWPREVERWVALLAILKTGATFVPVEADEPEAWLETVAQDCDAALILRHNDWKYLVSSEPRPLPEAAPSPLALLYTSGSSGHPKAVSVSWPATLNRFQWMWQDFPFASDDVLCHRSAFGFVDGLWEIFGGLLAGQPTAVLEPRATLNPAALAEALEKARVTRLVMVPSLLETLLSADPTRLRGLRIVVSSGETLSPSLARTFRERLPGVRLLNLYGSTEVAGDVTWHEVVEADSVPLGRPLPGCRVRLLDARKKPVPPGSIGEIYISGANLALGYWSGPEGRFEIDPESGQRTFRSGDLGRWDDQGNLHYLGRADRQLKLRGIRIQPEFLESTLLRLEGVREAHLTIRGNQLIAFVSGQGDVEEWGRQLRHRLPRSCWPDRLGGCDFLPRNRRGKIDTSALTAPLVKAPASTPGQTPLEAKLLDTWRRQLGQPQMGIHHNFFELGGNSLSALALLLECEKELARKIPLGWLFDAPTVALLATRLENDCEEGASNLVTLQSGEGVPLILLHAMGGGLDYYEDLIARLPGREIWGFFGLAPGAGDWTLTDLAEAYVSELERRLPCGPCVLLGLSLGGSIAYQMACSLQARGREVKLVIVDTYAPGYYQDPTPGQVGLVRRYRLWQRMQLQMGHLLRRVSPMGWPGYFLSKLERKAPKATPGDLIEQMRRALALYRPPQGQPALQAPTLLLRANHQPWHLRDPWLGWRRYLAGPVQVITIPGMHGTCLVEEPIVRVIVPPILDLLDRKE